MPVQTLVIDFDCGFASALGRVLEHVGCEVHVASTPSRALTLLGEMPFDSILIDSYTPAFASRSILREIYTRSRSKVYVMTDVPPLQMAPDTRREEGMDIVPAMAESVLSLVRETGDRAVTLVAGFRPPKDLEHTLSGEGYPTVLTHDISSAVRLFFEEAHPVVFLQIEVPALAKPDEFAILHTLTARSLAVLAHDLTSNDLRCGVKPCRIAEVTQILKDLREDAGNSDRMSLEVV